MPAIASATIVDEWHQLLSGYENEAKGLLYAVERRLHAAMLPRTHWSLESTFTGFLRSLCGKRRDCLVVRNAQFPEHVVFIITAPAGRNLLHVGWYLTAVPRLPRRARRFFSVGSASRREIGAELDAFDVADLQVFATVTHAALCDAIAEMAEDADNLEVLSAGDGDLANLPEL